jgi:hypothetical protein
MQYIRISQHGVILLQYQIALLKVKVKRKKGKVAPVLK